MLIGLTGTIAAGKGRAAAYLEKRGFARFSLSDELRNMLEKEGTPLTRDNLTREGNRIRAEQGTGYLAERVLRKLPENAVVDSIRHTDEVAVLKRRADFVLLAIDAPIALRFQRAKERGRIGDGETLERFREQEEREMNTAGEGQQIGRVMKLADETIVNDAAVENLYKRVDDLLSTHDTQRQKH